MPYDSDNCGNTPKNLTTIGICRNERLFPHDLNIFPSKIPSNLKGCPIKVVTKYFPPYAMIPDSDNNVTYWESIAVENAQLTGIEVQLVDTLGEMLNFRPAYK